MDVFGRIGVPAGDFSLNRKETPELDPGNNVVESLTNNITLDVGGGGGAAGVAWANVEDDGTISSDSGITSVTRVAEGIYDVVLDTAVAAVGDKWAASAVVTPEGTPTDTGTVSFESYLGLTTVSPSAHQNGVVWDPVKGKLWATDTEHDPNTDDSGQDRLGIYKVDSETWEYITLPLGWGILFVQRGPSILINVEDRVVYVQVAGQDDAPETNNGDRTTLIYSLDTLELLMNTKEDLTAGGSESTLVVLGFDSANGHMLIGGASTTYIHDMTDGLPDAVDIDSIASAYGSVSTYIADSAGKFWYPTTALAPDDWRRYYLSGLSLTEDTVEAGADGINADNLKTYDSTNNEIYYLSYDQLSLMKINCGTGTVTKLATYPAHDSSTHTTSPTSLTALVMSSDNSRVLGVRGGTGGDFMCFYIIDPSDGSVDFHAEIPDLYTDNCDSLHVGVDAGKLWVLSTQRITEISFAGGETDTALAIYDPVLFSSRLIAADTVRVWFYRGNNFRVRQDSAFHICVASDEVLTGEAAVEDSDIIPQLIKNADYTLTIAEVNYHLYHTDAGTHTYTIPANASVAFEIGTCISFVNSSGAGAVSIAITTDTLRWAGSTSTGTRTLAANGMATIIKVATALWYINGVGLT